MVNIKEFNNIVQYLKDTESGQVSYQHWFDNYKPKREKKVLVINDSNEKEWEKLWKLWPSNSNFEYQGKKYTGDRVLKAGQQVCRNIWVKAITDGVGADIIQAAAYIEIQTKKQESHRTGQNKLQYLNGLEVWLRQRKWEAWEGVQIEDEIKQPTFISNSVDM